MRQPELGQKLVQLRKEKDLTQEELVEACNVSIRTIQRIEAGEVTPRISTIKIILAALEEDISIFKTSVSQLHDREQITGASTWLRFAWIAGIVYLIMGFPEAILEVSRFEGESWGFLNFWRPSAGTISVYVLVKVISFVAFGFFLIGFHRLGTLFNNSILKISAYLMLSIQFLIGFLDVITLLLNWDDDLILSIMIAGMISIGGVGVVFGIGLIKVQDSMGKLALIAGIFEIAIGFFFITVVMFFFSMMLSIPATIIEIVLLYKCYEYINQQKLDGEQISV